MGALLNNKWVNHFLPVKVQHLIRYELDYCSILLSILLETPPIDLLFGFEKIWLIYVLASKGLLGVHGPIEVTFLQMLG